MRGQHTFANTVLALENAEADASDALAPDVVLASASEDPDVQTAASACVTAFRFARDQVLANPRLASAVNGARDAHDATVYDRKLAQLWVESFRRSGAAVAPRHRADYLHLDAELVDIENRFSRNLAGAAPTLEIGRRDAGGIPEDLLAGYDRGRDGSYRLPVNESTLPLLGYARSEDVRRRYWMAYTERAATSNVALLERAVAIRDRMAHMLGYEDWADYRLANRMAGSPARAHAFLAATQAALAPQTAADSDAMQSVLRSDERSDAVLQPWDVNRAEYLLRNNHGAGDDDVRQYFPAAHTVDAVLDVVHTTFGVEFERVPNADAWAPNVLEYRVSDEANGTPLGIVYLDLFARAHKDARFTSISILPSRGLGGVRRPAVAAVLGSWSQSANGPTLLDHAEIVTLFHALGHAMATILAEAPYETLSSGFRDDFAEAPSLMLENFAWQPDVLRRISSNWRTGAPLDDTAIASLAASRNLDAAFETSRMLALATYDLRLHAAGPRVDSTALFAATAAAQMPLLYAPGTHPQSSLFDVMSGFDAGLYAYPWSNVVAQDLFTPFASSPVPDPRIGARYREQILAPARTFEPGVEVRRFLGRASTSAAFYSGFGLNPNGEHE